MKFLTALGMTFIALALFMDVSQGAPYITDEQIIQRSTQVNFAEDKIDPQPQSISDGFPKPRCEIREIWRPSIGDIARYNKKALKGLSLSRKQIIELIQVAAKMEGVSPSLIHAMVQTESYYDINALSYKGAVGLMQVLPSTAKYVDPTLDVYNPFDNLRLGCRYIKMQLKRFKHVHLALAAYNAGPGRVIQYNGVPPYKETQHYIKRVRERLA